MPARGLDVGLRVGRRDLRLRLTDFNRLRWAVAALRFHPALRQRLQSESPGVGRVWIFDSSALVQQEAANPATGSWVILWDGLNSLEGLRRAHPHLGARADLRYLYVGSFSDVHGCFPAGSSPLFPAAASTQVAWDRNELGVPWWLDAMAAGRAWMRPYKNAHLAPTLHRRLRGGAGLVFCGLVRPNAAVLDSFFLGSKLHQVRLELQPLVDLAWDRVPGLARERVARAFETLAGAPARSAADHAAVYASVNVLHRMATLGSLHGSGADLLVNEYGVHPHLDPYDTPAYRRNLFLDFGSTRGSDLVYPRTVDLHLQGKAASSLRFLPGGRSLADFLVHTRAADFLALCDAHARQAAQGLADAARDWGRP